MENLTTEFGTFFKALEEVVLQNAKPNQNQDTLLIIHQ